VPDLSTPNRPIHLYRHESPQTPTSRLDYLPPESGGGSGCLQALVTVKSRSFVLLSWEINGSDY